MNHSERFLEHRLIFHLGNPSQDVVNSSQIQNSKPFKHKLENLFPSLFSPLPLAQPVPAGPARHSSLRPTRARTAKQPSKIGPAASPLRPPFSPSLAQPATQPNSRLRSPQSACARAQPSFLPCVPRTQHATPNCMALFLHPWVPLVSRGRKEKTEMPLPRQPAVSLPSSSSHGTQPRPLHLLPLLASLTTPLGPRAQPLTLGCLCMHVAQSRDSPCAHVTTPLAPRRITP